MALTESIKLNNGISIPLLGYGTFKVTDAEVETLVLNALESGYRHIDTAAYYRNEKGIGKALSECKIPREELFVTSKLWIDEYGYDKTLKAFDKTMKDLNLDYLDLYLLHWPRPLASESWKALEYLYENKKIRAIGVSNFTPDHLKQLAEKSSLIPAVNQIELHPGLQQKETRTYCEKNGIAIEAWSPIMKGQVMEEPLLIKIGEKYGKSPVQVTLRWHFQNNVIAIPKSSSPKRIHDNSLIFDFKLSEEEMNEIETLDSGNRLGPHPDFIYKYDSSKK